MCPDKKRPAGNTCRIAKGLDAVWAHFCPSKPCLPLSTDGIEFSGKSKTDFALDLVYECDDYTIPAYIKSGLKWLNEQKILE